MKTSTVLAIGTLGCALGLLIWSRQSSEGWQKANAGLRSQVEQAKTAQDSASPAEEGSNESRSELIRNRKEVRELREQLAASEKLQNENIRLTHAMAALKPAPRLSASPGFLAKEMWSNVGFLTPEQTLQTAFWALREGDSEEFQRCVYGTTLRASNSNKAADQIPRAVDPFIVQTSGYLIVDRRTNEDGSVVLGMQVAAGGQILDMHFRPQGTEWKLDQTKVFQPRN